VTCPLTNYNLAQPNSAWLLGITSNTAVEPTLGRVRKRHPRMFYRCLTHGALIREKDRIPLGWCFRTHPYEDVHIRWASCGAFRIPRDQGGSLSCKISKRKEYATPRVQKLNGKLRSDCGTIECVLKDVQYFWRLINLDVKVSGTLWGMGLFSFLSAWITGSKWIEKVTGRCKVQIALWKLRQPTLHVRYAFAYHRGGETKLWY